jgi:hypothetical protein
MRAFARVASIALLVVGALALISLVVWSIYIQQTTFGRGTGRAGLRTGFELAARLGTEYLVVLGVMAVGALALAYMQWTRRRVAFLLGTISSVLVIAAVWICQRYIVSFEDPIFVHRSPWVKAATLAATVATVHLSVLAVTSLVAWLTTRIAPPAE